jgi:hypothetical protein
MVASVAEGSGWDTCEFRQGAVGFRPGPVGGELEGAGRRWHWAGNTMPCRPGRGAGAGEVTARGNSVPALAALAARMAQVRHGRGGTLGHARGILF